MQCVCLTYVSLCVFVCLPVAIIIVTTFFCRQITVVYVCACASTAWKATSCNGTSVPLCSMNNKTMVQRPGVLETSSFTALYNLDLVI